MTVLGKLFIEETAQMEQWSDAVSSLAHSSLKVHYSYRLYFFVAKNHLRIS